MTLAMIFDSKDIQSDKAFTYQTFSLALTIIVVTFLTKFTIAFAFAHLKKMISWHTSLE